MRLCLQTQMMMTCRMTTLVNRFSGTVSQQRSAADPSARVSCALHP